MTWSVVTTGPYMEMLNIVSATKTHLSQVFDKLTRQFMFGPVNRRDDGTAVFCTPVEKGHVPMIALEDLGFWARYSFDNRELVSEQDLEVASDIVGWDYLVEVFKKVTGQKAVVVYQTLDDWMSNMTDVDMPVAIDERKDGHEASGALTWKQNFS